MNRLIKGVGRNFDRIFWPTLAGSVLLFYGVDFAQFTGIAALAPWSLWIGGSLIVYSISHVLRRLHFPSLDLQLIAKVAMESPTGAGLVFIGICMFICTLMAMLLTAIRT